MVVRESTGFADKPSGDGRGGCLDKETTSFRKEKESTAAEESETERG